MFDRIFEAYSFSWSGKAVSSIRALSRLFNSATDRSVAFMVVPPGIQHFEGIVTTVDLAGRSLELDTGATIRFVEGTMIVHDNCAGSLESLEAVAKLVRAGEKVKAFGLGLLETSEPFVLIAVTVAFRV